MKPIRVYDIASDKLLLEVTSHLELGAILETFCEAKGLDPYNLTQHDVVGALTENLPEGFTADIEKPYDFANNADEGKVSIHLLEKQ
jgi:hypothetical protein